MGRSQSEYAPGLLDRIEQPGRERQVVNVCRYVQVAFLNSQPLPGLLELRARIIQQGDPLEPLVARRVAPRAGPQLQQQPAFSGQQAPQRHPLGRIFVGSPALLPKGSLVIRTFVITYRGIAQSSSASIYQKKSIIPNH